MVQPINYSMNVLNPIEGYLQGLKFGEGILSARQQRAATEQDMRIQQATFEEQQRARAEARAAAARQKAQAEAGRQALFDYFDKQEARNNDGSSPITIGFSTLTSYTGYVGGKVNSVSISNPGSGYEVGDIVTFNNADFQNIYDQNTGIGFSFTVGNVVENFQISDVMLLQTVGSATTETHIIEYGGISNVEDLVEFSSNISGSNARLIVNPYYNNNEIKITRTSITK